RRVSALCTGRSPAASLRCGNTSQALRASSPQGEPLPSQTTSPKPPLEGRWHAKRDGEVCRRIAAAARKRPLHTPKPCGKLSADGSPQGEPFSQASENVAPVTRR